jgi:hypothetical protein
MVSNKKKKKARQTPKQIWRQAILLNGHQSTRPFSRDQMTQATKPSLDGCKLMSA